MAVRELGQVVITGASGGLGTAFAEGLAAQGRPLLLVGRDQGVLGDQAERLRTDYAVAAEIAIADLADPAATADLAARLAETDVELLINNAGFAQYGPYELTDADRQRDALQVLVVALAELSRAVAPQLVRQGHGGIINVASTAAFQPTPYLTGYAAAKAFVLSFGRALHAELRPKGVTVTTVCPGPVMTSFWDRVGSAEAAFGQRLTPEQVVRATLTGYRRGQPLVVPGLRNQLTAQANRIVPRRLSAVIAGQLVRPRSRP